MIFSWLFELLAIKSLNTPNNIKRHPKNNQKIHYHVFFSILMWFRLAWLWKQIRELLYHANNTFYYLLRWRSQGPWCLHFILYWCFVLFISLMLSFMNILSRIFSRQHKGNDVIYFGRKRIFFMKFSVDYSNFILWNYMEKYVWRILLDFYGIE